MRNLHTFLHICCKLHLIDRQDSKLTFAGTTDQSANTELRLTGYTCILNNNTTTFTIPTFHAVLSASSHSQFGTVYRST